MRSVMVWRARRRFRTSLFRTRIFTPPIFADPARASCREGVFSGVWTRGGVAEVRCFSGGSSTRTGVGEGKRCHDFHEPVEGCDGVVLGAGIERRTALTALSVTSTLDREFLSVEYKSTIRASAALSP